MTTAIIIGLLVLLGLFMIFIFNKFVRNRNLVNDAWSNIDAGLKRRHDLVPNLVSTVKGYAQHETSTFENVTRARNAAMQAGTGDINSRVDAENALNAGLKSLFALAEQYPELKANTAFLDLQQQLGQLEESLERTRRYYNATVRENNSFGEGFPGVLFAGLFGYKHFNFFETAQGEKAVPKVEF